MSDNITLPREVVQEAVEALVEARALLYDGRKQDKAADALRTALAAAPTVKNSLTVQVDALRGEVAHLRDQIRLANIDFGMSEMENDVLCREIAALQTKNERLRRDAERYNWLLNWLVRTGLLTAQRCQIDAPETYGDWYILRKPYGINGCVLVAYGKTEDAAIDAAMGAKP